MEGGRRSSAHLFYLPFRANAQEIGPLKGFDFTRASIEDRWREGAADMRSALDAWRTSEHGAEAGLSVHVVPSHARGGSRLDQPEFTAPEPVQALA